MDCWKSPGRGAPLLPCGMLHGAVRRLNSGRAAAGRPGEPELRGFQGWFGRGREGALGSRVGTKEGSRAGTRDSSQPGTRGGKASSSGVKAMIRLPAVKSMSARGSGPNDYASFVHKSELLNHKVRIAKIKTAVDTETPPERRHMKQKLKGRQLALEKQMGITVRGTPAGRGPGSGRALHRRFASHGGAAQMENSIMRWRVGEFQGLAIGEGEIRRPHTAKAGVNYEEFVAELDKKLHRRRLRIRRNNAEVDNAPPKTVRAARGG